MEIDRKSYLAGCALAAMIPIYEKLYQEAKVRDDLDPIKVFRDFGSDLAYYVDLAITGLDTNGECE